MLSIFHLLGQDVLTQSREQFRMYLSYLIIIIKKNKMNLKGLFYTSHIMIFDILKIIREDC